MVSETTKQVLWRKFKEAIDKNGLLKYIKTVDKALHKEMINSDTNRFSRIPEPLQSILNRK